MELADIEAQEILNFLCEILLNEARYDEDGISWETLKFKDDKTYQYFTAFGLIDGMSGKLLFLTEYYNVNKSADVKEIIYQGIKYIGINFETYGNKNIGFYNGIGGIIYSICYVSKTFEDEKLLEIAKNIVNRSNHALTINIYNLADGLAGYIMGLLYYLNSTNDKLVLNHIQQCLIKLLSGLKISPLGTYWYDSMLSNEGHKRLLFGNSGIIILLQQIKMFFPGILLQNIINESIKFANNERKSVKGKPYSVSSNLFLKNVVKPILNKALTNDSTNRLKMALDDYNNWMVFELVNGKVPSMSQNRDVKIVVEKYLIAKDVRLCSEDIIERLNAFVGLNIIHEKNLQVDNYYSKKKILEKLLREFKSSSFNYNHSLLNGSCGIGYYIIKLLTKSNNEIFLIPFYNNQKPCTFQFRSFCNYDIIPLIGKVKRINPEDLPGSYFSLISTNKLH